MLGFLYWEELKHGIEFNNFELYSYTENRKFNFRFFCFYTTWIASYYSQKDYFCHYAINH